jgi:transcriptional regulator with XRE-family HTH domain
MESAQFKAWRKGLGLKQREAAEKLGLKKRMIQYYETGKRDGKAVEIPKAIRLACYALAAGVEDFDGTARPPNEPKAPARRPAARRTAVRGTAAKPGRRGATKAS